MLAFSIIGIHWEPSGDPSATTFSKQFAHHVQGCTGRFARSAAFWSNAPPCQPSSIQRQSMSPSPSRRVVNSTSRSPPSIAAQARLRLASAGAPASAQPTDAANSSLPVARYSSTPTSVSRVPGKPSSEFFKNGWARSTKKDEGGHRR